MPHHQALILPRKQGQWEIGTRPTPKPGPGEILVKVHSAALNPVDWKIQKYGLLEDYPAVVGSDSSGIVEVVGKGVSKFVKGDRVVHQGWRYESDKAIFQQFALVPAEIVSKIPSSFSFDESATLPLGLATAAVGLYLPWGEAAKPYSPDGNAGIGLTPPWTAKGKGKYKGQSIVVLGGSSSVGQYAIQLARLSGFGPIITTSSIKHQALLKSYGATHVIDRNASDDDVVTQIKNLLPNGTANVVYDAISLESTQKIAVAVTKQDGLIVLTLPPAEGVEFGSRKAVRTFGNVHAQRKLGISLYSTLLDLLETDVIKPNRVEVLPHGLKGIIEGLLRLEKDQVSGVKLVARPWE